MLTFYTDDQLLSLAGLIDEVEGDSSNLLETAKPLIRKNDTKSVLSLFAKKSSSIFNFNDNLDVELGFNLLFDLLKKLKTEDQSSLKLILEAFEKDKNEKNLKLKKKILTGLFNQLQNVNNRLLAFRSLFLVFFKLDSLKSIIPIETFFPDHETVDTETLREFYLFISEKLESDPTLQVKSFEYQLKYLKTFQEEKIPAKLEAEFKKNLLKILRKSLALPEILNFEFFFDCKNLTNILEKGSDVEKNYLEILKIFNYNGFKEYNTFLKGKKNFFEKENLNQTDLTNKIRYLTFASLCTDSSVDVIEYSKIAEALEVKNDEVEMWVIDDAKINQLQQNIIVSRSTIRNFDNAEWKKLGNKVNKWRENLQNMLNVIEESKGVKYSTDDQPEH
ncbi:Eukaryotic translation initiation factor 3 subunit M [Clydaea vesicula]|uniref:Eukaryotic translation initiation factor 3 subunit M n=1 Tax=Clydaea vesicula TaxID=447962 RepID=A0AAD5TU02_9FUNG|nr:Eukaryotic translation initiation factor 3 subunit M [Clydaea vesicula]